MEKLGAALLADVLVDCCPAPGTRTVCHYRTLSLGSFGLAHASGAPLLKACSLAGLQTGSATLPLKLLFPTRPQSMYLVLVTNKSSNILEDLETLRLCGKVVPEYVEALEEEEVSWWPGAAASACGCGHRSALQEGAELAQVAFLQLVCAGAELALQPGAASSACVGGHRSGRARGVLEKWAAWVGWGGGGECGMGGVGE